MPRSALSAQRFPPTAAHATLRSVGCTTMRAMLLLSFNPANVQSPPPLVLLYTPEPQPVELRSFPSPVATQSTDESPAKTAMDPMDALGCLSKIGEKVWPLSLVFMTPPVARPA